MLRTLEESYRKAPHCTDVLPPLLDVLAKHDGVICDTNIALIECIVGLLEIPARQVCSSARSVEGAATARLVDLTLAEGGTAYLSGDGADDYQVEASFREAGVEFRDSDSGILSTRSAPARCSCRGSASSMRYATRELARPARCCAIALPMSDADFQLSGYGRNLKAALESGYRFVSFEKIGREELDLSCVLRHDVDSELLGCGPMLDVERSLGVRATYFVMTRSTAYNLFSVEGRAAVERILADGHALGLHFMGELCEGDTPADIAEKVRREAEWLKSEFGKAIHAVSFHQPSQAVLDGQVEIPGLVNTYNRVQMGAYFYVSDTNMQWRHEHPVDIFTRKLYPRLQLLIHPIWWTPRLRTVRQKWMDVLQGNNRALIDHWQKRERTLAGIDLKEDL